MVFIAAAPHIVGIFTADPVVLGHGVRGLRIISTGFAFYANSLVTATFHMGVMLSAAGAWIQSGPVTKAL